MQFLHPLTYLYMDIAMETLITIIVAAGILFVIKFWFTDVRDREKENRKSIDVLFERVRRMEAILQSKLKDGYPDTLDGQE